MHIPAIAAVAATVASAYVQFDNSIALHLDEPSDDVGWSSVYLDGPSALPTMDAEGRGIEFVESEAEINLWPGCNQVPVTAAPCQINVLFAISQCLDKSTAVVFKQWMEKLAANEDKFFTGGKACDLVYSTVVLTDCTAKASPKTSPSKKIYLPTDVDATVALLAQDRFPEHAALLTSTVATQDLIDLFTPFGDVYCSLNATSSLRPDAVVSLFADAVSHKAVTDYEQDRKIHTVFNFHVCHDLDASTCAAQHSAFADDSTLLVDDTDLFMHNPFKAVQSFHCAQALPNGLPVVSLDAANVRQCRCRCPTGFDDTLHNGQRMCVPTPKPTCACYWSNRQYRLEISNATAYGKATCDISKLYPATINRIPYPRSNYVAVHKNRGDKDNGAVDTGAPLIQVTVTKRTAESPTAKTIFNTPYAWTYFEMNRDAIVNRISLDGPGVYNFVMKAKGYRSDADCSVCLAVVDKFRPFSTARCPTALCDQPKCESDPTAEWTASNLQLVRNVHAQHVAYAANAINDGCGLGRCDDNHLYRKDMFATEYVEANVDLGATCLNDAVPAKALAKLKTSPLNAQQLQLAKPVADGLCTRCCKYTTQLKEYWHDYKCGNSTAVLASQAQQCSGTDPGCKTVQCLRAQGTTLFQASAAVHPTYKAATDELIKRMYPSSGYESTSEIHLLLECTTFGVTNEGKCAHLAPIRDLFTTAASIVPNAILKGTDASAFVAWRFRINGGPWRTVADDSTPIRFDTQATNVVLEAWSQCGLVKKTIFNVYLHLNRKLCTAEAFDTMWYQSSSTFDGTGALCNVQESDFAELTFDFNPMAGLVCGPKNASTPRMPYVSTGVICTVQYAATPASSAVLVASAARNTSVVRRFSVQMLSEPTTKAETSFTVACSFSYQGFQTPNVSVAVSKTFTIRNCDTPGWDCPLGECTTKCATAKPRRPAPFQACGGLTIYATAADTVVTALNDTCCATCGPAVCQSIWTTPTPRDTNDIKRCIVPEAAPLKDEALLESEVVGASVLPMACGVLVLGLAMVVAMVATGRRDIDVVFEDDYYPLLDK